MIHLETITPKMHDNARIIHASLDASYYLAGGTALALLSGHRESTDLDYFINSHIDTLKLKTVLRSIFPTIIFTYEDVDTLWCTVDDIKVSFISRFAPRVDGILDEDVFRIAGLKDIVVMKLAAICGRDEYKDYYDLATLSTLTDVRAWVSWWNEVYPESDPISWITALSRGEASEFVTLKGPSIRSQKEILHTLEKATKEAVSFF